MVSNLKSVFLVVSFIGLSQTIKGATPTLDDVIDKWQADICFSANVRYIVSMPEMSDDVTYNLVVATHATNGEDSCSPANYIIDWTLFTPNKELKGFSAYFQGNHYLYTGRKRIQEYHYVEDSIPFIISGGIHRSAQFVDILPPFMAESFRKRINNPEYVFHITSDTIIEGKRATTILSNRIVGGAIVQEAEYIIDPATYLPTTINIENNPGAIGEQTIKIKFDSVSTTRICPPENEVDLSAKYPELFITKRDGMISLQSIVDRPLPDFSLPTLTGERYTYSQGDHFRAPLILVIIDPEKDFSREIAADIRRVGAELQYSPVLIFASLSSNIDLIEETLGEGSVNEYYLMSAYGLARDCGIIETPVVILAETDGTVRQVIQGYNNTLRESVIKKMRQITPTN